MVIERLLFCFKPYPNRHVNRRVNLCFDLCFSLSLIIRPFVMAASRQPDYSFSNQSGLVTNIY